MRRVALFWVIRINLLAQTLRDSFFRMSKAFTRESDDLPERFEPRPSSSLPPEAKNYLTADGARRLSAELDQLTQVERPPLAAARNDGDARRQLQILDQRIHQLQQSIRSAEIVAPQVGPPDRVRFGATVTARDREGQEASYRIVGVDETDFDRGWVSWISPIAKALMNAQVGQSVRFKLPSGEQELEILGIVFEETAPKRNGPA